MAKVYYVGDWAVLTGPWFAESPFQNAMKGVDVFNYGTWLKEAVESSGVHQVTSVPSWEFYKLGPGAYERILAEYDVITVADLPTKVQAYQPSHVLVPGDDASELVALDEVERRYILRVMEAVGGNRTRASEVLGVDRKTLYSKLKSYGWRASDPGA